MRIFLDANILFSAARADAAMRELLHLLHHAGHDLCADAYVVTEARRNLAAKEAGDAVAALEVLLQVVSIKEAQHVDTGSLECDWLPLKDRPVLRAAIALECEALVTGDRTHFGAGYGKVFAGVTVLSPRQLAEQLLGI
ncbi:MAG: PIN domain-containing protein [Variovorax sp.]